MFASPRKVSLLLIFSTLILNGCSQGQSGQPASAPAQAAAAPTAQSTAQAQAQAYAQAQAVVDADAKLAAAIQSLELATREANYDKNDLVMLVSWGPSTDVEMSAVTTAKAKMAAVKGAKAINEDDKKTAAAAKAAYNEKVAAYQAALNEANNAKQNRVKAMAALSAAQKELDDAWAAVGAARENYNKIVMEPKSTAEQKAAGEAAMKKAYARADQAAAALGNKMTELQTSQINNHSFLSSVTVAADATTEAGAFFAEKAAIAAKSAEVVVAAIGEERKAMGVIASLNRARAQSVADSLVQAHVNQGTTAASAERAKAAANAAAAANKAATERQAWAAKEDSAAKLAVETTATAVVETNAIAEAKAAAKAVVDSEAVEAAKAYSEVKAVYDSALAVSAKSAADAKIAAKAVADAGWRAKVAAKAVEAAEAAIKVQDSKEAQKALADAQAAASAANAALEEAKMKAEPVNAQAAADAAATEQAKAAADERLIPHKQAQAVAAAAAREKASADAAAANAVKAAANARANAAAKATALEKANAAADAASAANNAAAEKFADAAQTQSDAKKNYDKLFSQNEAYKLTATRTEAEENSDEKKLYAAALWNKAPEGNKWTSLVVAAIRADMHQLNKAKDVNDWCPGYESASEHHKEVCWLRIIGGLVLKESNYKANDAFKEPSGSWSVGLMALTPDRRECRTYDNLEHMKQGILNLSCGVDKFAGLIEADGYIQKFVGIDERTGKRKFLGAAKYWSTLRPPYKQLKPNSRKKYYNLGKMNEISAFSKEYKNF